CRAEPAGRGWRWRSEQHPGVPPARSVTQAGRKVTRSTERRPAVEPAADVATEAAACHHRRPGTPLHTHPAATWWTAGSTERAAKLAMSESPGSPELRALPIEHTAGPLASRPALRAWVEAGIRFRTLTKS